MPRKQHSEEQIIYAAAAERFALITVNTASGTPRQGFATPAKNAALDRSSACPKNRQYQGEALSTTLILETRN